MFRARHGRVVGWLPPRAPGFAGRDMQHLRNVIKHLPRAWEAIIEEVSLDPLRESGFPPLQIEREAAIGNGKVENAARSQDLGYTAKPAKHVRNVLDYVRCNGEIETICCTHGARQ